MKNNHLNIINRALVSYCSDRFYILLLHVFISGIIFSFLKTLIITYHI